MGLALDGLKEGDETIAVEGLPFLLSNDVVRTIKDFGGLTIDYVDSTFHGKGFRLSLSGAGSC